MIFIKARPNLVRCNNRSANLLNILWQNGIDLTDNFRRAATYANRILKGARPSELPVQAPIKYELVINLKTAKVLGLDVPLLLQQQADEVIE
ncbi:MAG: ABC transporter substrate binding protein [Xanthobacteraceae bacterium]